VQRLVDAALVVVAMVIPTQHLDFVQKLTHASAPLVDHETNLLVPQRRRVFPGNSRPRIRGEFSYLPCLAQFSLFA
jgi:hypothetical protein